MKCSCSLAILLCLAFTGDEVLAAEAENKGQSDERRFTYSIGSTVVYYGQYRIPAVPELVRAVPLHEDDGYLAGRPLARNPIVQADTGTVDLGTIGVNVLASYRKWFELGARLSYVALEDNRVQQNQFGGTERGNGTSLRFYDLESKMPVSLILVGGISLPIVPARENWRGMRLALGGEYDPLGTEVRFTAGWDRFDRDEDWRHFDIGRLHNDGLYARLDIAFGETGWAFVQVNHSEVRLDLEEEFKDVAIECSGTPVIFGLRFAL